MSERPNRVLEFLTAPPQPNGEASRSNRRRRSSVPIELSWFTGTDWHSARGKLHDISRGGACLLAADRPPLTRQARFRFVEGECCPWIEVEILAVEPGLLRRNRVRVRFESPCSSFFLRSAVLDGTEASDDAPAIRHKWVAVTQEIIESTKMT